MFLGKVVPCPHLSTLFFSMSVLGIGVDIVEIDRFAKFEYDKEPFLQRVFDQNELDYCFSQTKPERHLAARFAAKEAAVKALSTVTEEEINYKKIIVENNKKGMPSLDISKYTDKIARVSLSHSQKSAIAFVIIDD